MVLSTLRHDYLPKTTSLASPTTVNSSTILNAVHTQAYTYLPVYVLDRSLVDTPIHSTFGNYTIRYVDDAVLFGIWLFLQFTPQTSPCRMCKCYPQLCRSPYATWTSSSDPAAAPAAPLRHVRNTCCHYGAETGSLNSKMHIFICHKPAEPSPCNICFFFINTALKPPTSLQRSLNNPPDETGLDFPAECDRGRWKCLNDG
ncbi:hypothetical protein F5Y18DRAFT_187541 [Xylariaceae sp. FL1019]|nr:hypothetical protein F5Y18DRAFT_187541 [Xylariaceae sp. FL1019]